MEVCVICENIAFEKYSTLTIKGCNKINEVNLACGGKSIAKVGDKVRKLIQVFMSTIDVKICGNYLLGP